ncbi:hypothetical protein GQ53DRAFT_804127 [Thozetella sp. PMI_491]|nr:hypothetical protein GQ53DRAFT_804127 [Thozetella sp. PMI_491]
MSEPQGLCEKCRDLSFETLGASNGYLHSASYREFIAGAQTCALCRLIASDHRGVLPDVESVNPSGELVTFSLTSNLTGEQNARMVVHVSTGNGGAWYIHLDVFTMQHSMYTLKAQYTNGSWPARLLDVMAFAADNSEKDWQTEAYKIGIIYSQAVVTIAADAGTGCDSGCFNTQSESDMKFPSDAVRVTSISSDKRATSLWFHKKRLDANFSFTYGDNIDSAPLQSRGWTLQERMFSPRILHFGAKMLYWECRQRLAAEDYHRMRFDKDTTTSGLLTTILETKDYLRTPIRQIITRWYTSIVENYSRRSLTYQKDKFPAILAVAKLVQEQTGSEYLAGLWRLNLQYGLFWKCVGPAARSPEYIAPTFSWASVANAVKWNEDVQADMVEAEFEVEDFHVEAAGNDPFGRIRSSWLRLSGHVLAAKVRPPCISTGS